MPITIELQKPLAFDGPGDILHIKMANGSIEMTYEGFQEAVAKGAIIPHYLLAGFTITDAGLKAMLDAL